MDGPLILVLLFVLRLGLPLAVLFALGYLYERWAVRQSADIPRLVEDHTTASPRVGYAAQAAPCWELKGCSPEERKNCPAAQRPGLPCWLVKQMSEGGLPEDCLDCGIFKSSHDRQPHLSA